MLLTKAKRALSVAGAVAILAGCSSAAQSSLSPSTAVVPNKRAAAQAGYIPMKAAVRVRTGKRFMGASWTKVKPNSAGQLIYVTNAGSGTVGIYTYQKKTGLQQVGQLTGFSYPSQPCVDKQSNVYIPDYYTDTITEFAKGSTTPIQTLTDPAQPYACAVDPRTGNLATADFTAAYTAGLVNVYPGGTGTPTTYQWASTNNLQDVAYDTKSNLFVNGQEAGPQYTPGLVLGELPKGGTAIQDLSTSGFSVSFAGKLLWDGQYLLVGDQGPNPSSMYQTTFSGTTVTAVSSATFSNSSDVVGFWTRKKPGGLVFGIDYANSILRVDTYPALTAVTNTSTGVSNPYGVVVVP